ncbi:MAG TPA: hypothetical protein VMZ03_12580 [Chitinophagaceae bacterium]|nr:hypothetical protein [Chitinophagaceae bacterium]
MRMIKKYVDTLTMYQPMYLCNYVVPFRSIITAILSFVLLIFSSCKNDNTVLTEVKELPDYPSASGIELFKRKVYIIGDDANNMLVLDSNLNIIDSVPLYSYAEKRIPKQWKADLESITVLNGKLFMAGSGSSLSSQRNVGWIYSGRKFGPELDSIRLDTFYRRIALSGIPEINIEGVCAIPGTVIFSNRGNKNYRKNQLVFTNSNFLQQQVNATINTALIGSNSDSTSFSGVSGMGYARKSDCLILTVSTEDTRNAMDDGAIGKSYLWLVKNISSKKNWKAINPDIIIDLDKTDRRFKGQKIESVCVIKEDGDLLYLLLAADNDNGSSTLFQMAVSTD